VTEPRARRIAENESRFREINERLRADLRALPDDEPVEFVCECGRLDCSQPVRMTVAEYEATRGEATEFFVVPGHEAPDVEDVVDGNERFARVRKRPDTADLVRETDPRSD
jgi:hypothetical protein